MTVMRSVFYVPSNNEKMVLKASTDHRCRRSHPGS